MGKPLHLDKTKWNVYNFRSRTVSSQTAELPNCASSLPRKRAGKKVRARALRQHTAIENLLTDATQQPLEFYNSRLSAQAAAVTPVVLLGEAACSAASTAPSPVACSNDLLEPLNGLDAHTVEVDDAVLLQLDSEYGLLWMLFCIVVLIVHIFSEQHEHGEQRVLDRPQSGEHPGKSFTVSSIRRRLSAPGVWHHTRGGHHQCLGRVQPHASGGSALQLAWSFRQRSCYVCRAQESPTSLGCRWARMAALAAMGQALPPCAFFSWVGPSQRPTGRKGNAPHVPSRLW